MTPLQKYTAQAIVNIFETGSEAGDYSSVSVIDGDAGHLSYGRAQVSLASGNLSALVSEYCATSGAVQAGALRPFLTRLEARDLTLDHDASLRSLLVLAGADAVMHAVQDRFFDRLFWEPALTHAAACRIETPLGVALIFDSLIQGGWAALRKSVNLRSGTMPAIREECWLEFYARARHRWLSSSHPPLPATAYRMDVFLELIKAENFNLDLPITVRGIVIRPRALPLAA